MSICSVYISFIFDLILLIWCDMIGQDMILWLMIKITTAEVQRSTVIVSEEGKTWFLYQKIQLHQIKQSNFSLNWRQSKHGCGCSKHFLFCFIWNIESVLQHGHVVCLFLQKFSWSILSTNAVNEAHTFNHLPSRASTHNCGIHMGGHREKTACAPDETLGLLCLGLPRFYYDQWWWWCND